VRVLIVEDDKDTADVICAILSSCECRTASTRDEALAIIKSGFVPGCVLMDYMMPGMSLADFLQATEAYDLRVVLMTAHRDAIAIAELMGICSSILKPLDTDELLRVVK
jgi:DNA-binding NtrC family response regulator